MKIIITVMLSVSILSHAFAQQLPGVLPIALDRHSKYSFDLGQGNKMLVYARTVQDLQKFQNLDSVLTLFAKEYKEVKSALTENTNAKIATYKLLDNNQHQLDLREQAAAKQRFQFRTNGGEPLLIKDVQDTLLIIHTFLKPIQKKSETVQLNEYVYFCLIINNLEDVEVIAKNGIGNAKISQALKDVAQYPHHNLQKTGFRYNLTYAPDSDKPSFKAVETQNSPFIAIHPSFGLGIFRNQWVPNFQADFSFVPNKYKNIGYTVGWRSLFFTERNDLTGRSSTQSNRFVSVGITFYDFRRPKTGVVNTNHILFGAYLGHSVLRSGDIFDKNTWNFSMTITTKGMFKIQPEIYFNGFFKSVTPGLRLQIGI